MPGLTPLSTVSGFTKNDPQATREQIHGGTIDPKQHGRISDDPSLPIYAIMPDEIAGPYGLENELLGMDVFVVAPAGTLGEDPTADLQPVTRAAPWPKGTPTTTNGDDLADRHAQVTAIRNYSQGASKEASYLPTLEPKNSEWATEDYIDPGESLQVPIPKQLMTGAGGFGSRDRTQSTARQNEYGFDSAHRQTRWQTNGLIGNNLWMEPGSRPMRKGVAGPAIVPTGHNSPFAGQNPGDNFDTRGAVLNDLPAPYDAPNQPSVGAPFPTSDWGYDPATDWI